MVWLAFTACSLVALVAVYALYIHDDNTKLSKGRTPTQTRQNGSGDRKSTLVDTTSSPERDPSKESDRKTIASPIEDSESYGKDALKSKETSKQATTSVGTPVLEVQNTNGSTTKMLPPALAMPPPSLPSPQRLKPPTFSQPPRLNGVVRTPPSAASSLRVPPQKALSNASMIPSATLRVPQKKSSRQVMLTPGHSPLDWATLTKDPSSNLRGKDAPSNLIKITPTQLRTQNGRKGKDAWTSYQGRVYNITPYLPFHPGGEPEILKGAGRDSGQLFMEVHPWVNWEGMLSECLVGILVSDAEKEEARKQHLDEMD